MTTTSTDQRLCIALLIALLSGTASSSAGTVTHSRDEATGWNVVQLEQGNTTVKLLPEAGGNVFSIRVDGVEFLLVPPTLDKLPGVGFGNPILYPMPNRVRGASFTFEGSRFEFPANGRGNFIHGLVNREAWSISKLSSSPDSAEVTLQLKFAPGTPPFEMFPREHTLRLTVHVVEQSVSMTYQVDNSAGTQSIPFGFAFHPYFLYQGQRSATYLTVPATHLMESTRQLPSGNLLPLQGHRLDARQPTSLESFVADDVYWGLDHQRPTVVEFRDVGRSIELTASEAFTHLVVYTPRDRPFFCIENQTCSTDAHNLASQGKQDVAHLQVCPPGETMSGWVKFRFMTKASRDR